MVGRGVPILSNTPRRWPVRVILTGIVFALVFPGLVFCGVLLGRFASAERSRSEAEAQATAVRTADALDRELGSLIGTLRALATSPALADDDLVAFARQVRAIAAVNGQNIVLSDPIGQQLVNTRLPPGASLPRVEGSPWRKRAVLTGAPAVSDLFTPLTIRIPSLSVLLPVQRDGRIVYMLSTIVDPAAIAALLVAQGLPEVWIVSVIDSTGAVIARSRDHAQSVGRQATADLLEHAVGERGTWQGHTLDGMDVLAAFARVRLAPWRVAVGIPLHVAEGPLRSTVMLLTAVGLAILLLSSLLAWQLGRSITLPLQRLAQAGAALGQGLPVTGVRSSIAEVDAVSGALVQATADLRSRAQALAAERAQLLAVIETVPVGLLIADAGSGRIVSGNLQVERVLGHEPLMGDIGASLAEWNGRHGDGTPVQLEEMPLGRALAGDSHASLQYQVWCGDRGHRWVQVEAAPIRIGGGAITGAVVAFLDIDEVVRGREEKARSAENLEAQVAARTAELEAANQRLRDEIAGRAKAEEQLRQSQKMEAVGRLTGGIAHDFNNLLTIIIGSLDLLRRRNIEYRNRRLLENAMEGATRAATLTSRLLAFSRQQPLAPQPLDVNRLVAGMSDLLHRTLGEVVRVETVLAGGLWQTHADPNQLENALLNLAVNARDAMADAEPGGGRLTIETANAYLDEAYTAQHAELHAGQYVMIAVSDTGTGMEPDVVARVFEPFFTTKPLGQGTGLGLSQVHGFVKQSGGHVVIYTERGQGTTVKIYLPRFTAPTSTEPLPEPARPAQPSRTGETVLLVEDEQGVRRFSSEALHELGYTVLEADGAVSALRLLDAHPEIALLFTDVVLPDMNGRKLAEEATRRRPGLPVLFTTGYTRNAIVHNGQLDAGVDLIGKPFTVEALGAKLREVLDRAR